MGRIKTSTIYNSERGEKDNKKERRKKKQERSNTKSVTSAIPLRQAGKNRGTKRL